MTMVKKIEIPADRHLKLDFKLPESFSTGQAEITLVDNVANTQKIFAPMPSIAELVKSAEKKAAMERETGYNPFEGLKGCMKDSPCFADKDGMEIQIEMRNEWPD